MFYETDEDLIDTCVSFFEAGLRHNEFCVWAVSNPLTPERAIDALGADILGIQEYLRKGQIEFLNAEEWYLKDDICDFERISSGWAAKYDYALKSGYEGLRISGNAVWLESRHWKKFCEYEHEIDCSLADKSMLILCTYRLDISRASDILDVADAHQYSIARRNGRWELLENPALKQVRHASDRRQDASEGLSRPFPGYRSLTARERSVLAHVISGASSKEIGQALAITHRTVEFHRSNIMKKFGAKNTADLLRIALGK